MGDPHRKLLLWMGIDFSFTRCDSRHVATNANDYLPPDAEKAAIQTIYLMFSGPDTVTVVLNIVA